ncbi:phosphatase 2C-like domain-containing protein [Pelagophyceae sp. CCMP2097]|nr:phosphatase 2C-like domain-containing protein [Pelagophyceae sp. CCMP2097]
MFRGLYPDQLTKPCQDSYAIHDNVFPDRVQSALWFMVFDGHGPDGHECAWYARDNLEIAASEIYSNKPHMQVEALLKEANETVNRNMHACKAVPSVDSGTTAVSILSMGETLYCSNAGDSRCILGKRQATGTLAPTPLSFDHTLYRADERLRVQQMGGRVLSIGQIEGRTPLTQDFNCNLGDEIDADGDPPRLWMASKFEPGCAFSRSLGDKKAELIGCIATPEVTKHDVQDEDEVVVIASDGVWEFLTNQDVLDICDAASDPAAACYDIVARSYAAWYEQEERIDDISVIVLFLNGKAKSAPSAADPSIDAHLGAAPAKPVDTRSCGPSHSSSSLVDLPPRLAVPTAAPTAAEAAAANAAAATRASHANSNAAALARAAGPPMLGTATMRGSIRGLGKKEDLGASS